MNQCPWSDWDPATIKFCEERLCAWIREPSNTWSNLAILFAGIYIYYKNRTAPYQFGTLFVLAAIFLSFGSFMFHLSATFFFEAFDLMGMFLISGLMLVINWSRFFKTKPAVIRIAYYAMSSISLGIMLVWREAGIPVFGLQIAVALTLETFCHLRGDPVRYRYSIFMIAAFVISFIIWRLDIQGPLCIPTNHLVTGHAVWHALNALAIVFMYQFYRENNLLKDLPKNPG